MKTKQTAKHTPGPWLINPDGYLEMRGEETLCDASVVSDLKAGFEEASANLRLVAAAPDLLAALQAIVTEISGPGKPYSTESWLPEKFVAAASAAITKATQPAAETEAA